jgi:hypothetical protein
VPLRPSEDTPCQISNRRENALTTRILEGTGEASPSLRRAAFNNSGLAELPGALVDKVARHAYRVADEDIADKNDSLEGGRGCWKREE